MTPAILVVTGASGSGKTAAVRALDARDLPGVRCYYFDTVGVPSREEMERDLVEAKNGRHSRRDIGWIGWRTTLMVRRSTSSMVRRVHHSLGRRLNKPA
jgi:adenylylsulfate kinase-like enzyme